MKATVTTFKNLARCAALGEHFKRKDAIKNGCDYHSIDSLIRMGLITSTGGNCKIEEDAYREMTEVQRLLDKVE